MLKLRNLTLAYLLLSTVFIGCKTTVPQSSQPTREVLQDSLAAIDSVEVVPVMTDTIPADSLNEGQMLLTDSLPMVKTDSLALIPVKKDTIILTGVGDVMLGTNFPESYYLPPNEGRDMLAGVSHIFEDADIVFGNLEGVILDSGGTQKECRNPKACYLFRSPEYMGDRLQEAGFNLMSVANNHAGDFGDEGRENTGRTLDNLGINFAGNMARPWLLFEKDGINYGFAAFSPNKGTPNINNLKSAKETIMHLDSLADIVIVSFHGGAEGSKYTSVPREHEYFYGEDRGDVYHFAHALVDAGADVIFGHGPHVPRAIDIYKKRFIAYSLGNFATYARFNLRGDNGLAPIVKIKVNNAGEFLDGQIISCLQTGRGIPQIDSRHRAASRIFELTKKDLPEVQISIDQKGFISYLHK